MVKVVIAAERGCRLTPEAALWLYARGWKGIEAFDADDWYDFNPAHKVESLDMWRRYLKGERGPDSIFVMDIFSPDEKFIISHFISDGFRADPLLIECLETLKDGSGGQLGHRPNCEGNGDQLKIVEIPDGIEWQLEESEGCEWIAEKHRTWD